MDNLCTDNRFEMIEKYKKALIEATNIETSADEMKVIDNVLFRFWQMGWLEKLETTDAVEVVRCEDCNWCHKAVFAKYWNGEEIERCYCDIHKRYTNDEYYCADGERRDNG